MINQHKNMPYCKTLEQDAKLLTCCESYERYLNSFVRDKGVVTCSKIQSEKLLKKSFVPKATMTSSRTLTNKQVVMDALQMLYFFRAWKSSGFPACSSVSLTMIGIIICQATKEMPCASKNPDSTDFSLNPLRNDFLDIFVLWPHNTKASQELRITTDKTKKRQT